MKKGILVFLSFCFIFLLSIGASANVMPEWNNQMVALKPITDGVEFNIMVGCQDDYMTNTPFYCYADQLSATIRLKKGGFYWTGEIVATTNSNISADVYAEFTIDCQAVMSATVKLDDELIYDMDTTGCDDPKSNVNKEIDLNDYFNTEGLIFTYYCNHDFNLMDDSEYDDTASYYLGPEDFGMSCIIGTIYNENTVYDGSDLYFVTSVVSPISEEALLNTIRVEDATEGTISTKARIEDSEYVLTDGAIGVGVYSLKIVASDTEGNTTVQKAYVNVADVTPPVIEASDKEVEYCKHINDLKTLFTATDNSGSCTLTIIEDNYTANASKLGTYTVTAKAVDSALNETTKTINITVIDKIAPYFVTAEHVATTTNQLSSKNDLLNYITCIDYIDGTNTRIEIDDTDHYFDNKTTLGTYNFDIRGYDQSGNLCSGVYKLKVADGDYPEIYADSYTITVNRGEKLSREDVANLLLNLGQITSTDNVVLQSAYFDNFNEAGDYELIISTPEAVYTGVISVKDNANSNNTQASIIDYTVPTVEAQKDNTYLYVIIAVAGVLIISSLGIFIYKRKH